MDDGFILLQVNACPHSPRGSIRLYNERDIDIMETTSSFRRFEPKRILPRLGWEGNLVTSGYPLSRNEWISIKMILIDWSGECQTVVMKVWIPVGVYSCYWLVFIIDLSFRKPPCFVFKPIIKIIDGESHFCVHVVTEISQNAIIMKYLVGKCKIYWIIKNYFFHQLFWLVYYKSHGHANTLGKCLEWECKLSLSSTRNNQTYVEQQRERKTSIGYNNIIKLIKS